MDPCRLDLRDLICPIPVLKARKALQTLPAGAVLEVLATDPAAGEDLRSFCAATGHRFLDAAPREDGATLYRIAAADDPTSGAGGDVLPR